MKASLITTLSFAALFGLLACTAFATEKLIKPQQEIAVFDEAKIKAEITKVMDGFKAAVEKADLPSVLAVPADVPEFRYILPDGTMTDFAGWKQGHIEYFAQIVGHRLTVKSAQITVLGPDVALVAWRGAMDVMQKDGPVLRVDPFAATFVFRRLGGIWKLVHQHESGPPPQPVNAVPTESVKS